MTYVVKLTHPDLLPGEMNVVLDYEDDLVELAIAVYHNKFRDGDSLNVPLYVFQVDDYEEATTTYMVTDDRYANETPGAWTKHQKVRMFVEVGVEIFYGNITL